MTIQRRMGWLLGMIAACVGACRSNEQDLGPSPVRSAAAAAVSRAAPPTAPAPQAPRALLFLPTSAHQASLAMDAEAVYVFTKTGVHRIVLGKSTETFPLELEFGATLTADAFVYWSKGALWEAPKLGGSPRRLAALARPPRRFAAAGERVVWIDASKTGAFSIQALEGPEPRVLYASPGTIDALAVQGELVFFVERSARSDWRIGSVTTRGEQQRFTEPKRGRSPAQLAAFGDALYYQDPSGFRVVELSRDLERERTLARNLVCSPLAVWDRVYCAQVEGLVELAGDERRPRMLAANARGLITAVAANASAVLWLSEAGADQLTLRLLSREPP